MVKSPESGLLTKHILLYSVFIYFVIYIFQQCNDYELKTNQPAKPRPFNCEEIIVEIQGLNHLFLKYSYMSY